MKEIELLPVERGRTWLPISYNGSTTRIFFPPVQETHQEAFAAIGDDKELTPAQGLDLALIAHGAYNGKDSIWEYIKQNAFFNHNTRSPTVNTWIPKGKIEGDDSLSGVLVQKDLNGKGLTSKVNIPDLAKFKQNASGLYVSQDSIFVPSYKYKLGEHTAESFSKDGFTIATLTPEGAELFAKTAVDTGKTPHTLGIDINTIANPEKRVSVFKDSTWSLGLVGYYYDNSRFDFAFAVSASKN
ncbi:MAG: hypothetical protein AABX35_00195 [Nanoarchaeota archaeon]